MEKNDLFNTTYTANAAALTPINISNPQALDMYIHLPRFRTDIRESQTGASCRVKLRLINARNSEPIQNVRVDLWNSNAIGHYAGRERGKNEFNGLNAPDYSRNSWLQGIQMCDTNGEVEFTTIFPGMSNGEESRIYFRIFVTPLFEVSSYFGFPDTAAKELYATHAPYSKYLSEVPEERPVNEKNDALTASLIYNNTENIYDIFLEIPIQLPEAITEREQEPETNGQFSLQQASPDPADKETVIPFTLANHADLRIELFDVSGRRAAMLLRKKLSAGKQAVRLNFSELGIPGGKYIYQFQVTNEKGCFRQCKVMTVR